MLALEGRNELINSLPGIKFAEALDGMTAKLNLSPVFAISKKIEESLKGVDFLAKSCAFDFRNTDVYKLVTAFHDLPVFALSRKIQETLNPLQIISEHHAGLYMQTPVGIRTSVIKDFGINIQLLAAESHSDPLGRTSSQSSINEMFEMIARAEHNCVRCVPITTQKTYQENQYLQEKIKGGSSSYKRNHALRHKVQELCDQELAAKNYPSAIKLCEKVAEIIERDYFWLLEKFNHYTQSKINGNDWRFPTFYSWYNHLFKKKQMS